MLETLTQAIQRSVLTVLAVTVLSTILGLGLGTLASRRASVWDGLTGRLLELSGALQLLIVIPLLQNLVFPVASTIATLACYQGLRLARLCRNETVYVRRHGFVLAARALGLSAARTQWSHVLPHAAPALAVNIALTVPLVVSCEAALAFLGLDKTPSFGALIVSASPAGVATLLAVLALTYSTHLVAERAVRRLLPHTFEAGDAAPLATSPDPSR